MFLTPTFPHEFQRTVLLDPGNHLSNFPLRGYHPLWRNVPDDFWSAGEDVTGPLHISPEFPRGIRFALCRFRSPLLAASRLISFPPGTKMFQFPGFPTPEGLIPKYQEVPLGNRWITGSMCLPTAYRNLVRPSSALEPSHSPNGVVVANLLAQLTSNSRMIEIHRHHRLSPLSFSFPREFQLEGCTVQNVPSGQMTLGHPAELGVFNIPYL
jgi:hypothetical protein